MAVYAGLVLLLSCGAVHTLNKGCYNIVAKCQSRFHQKIRNHEELNDKCSYFDSLLTCLTETSSMSERCKATVLMRTKALCLGEENKCDKAMCSKADGFTASNANSRPEEGDTCHRDQECHRRAKKALLVASSHTKCSMYQEDYKCYGAIPKTCNFSGKVTTQKNNCVSKCTSLKVSVNENCEMKDVAQSASPVSNLPASTTTISPVVSGSHTAGKETTTVIPRGTTDDDVIDDNAGRIPGNMTGTGNDVRTPSPLSGESKSGAGLMRAPVGVMEILLVWTLGHLL